jgi:hypothetical protein
MVPEITTRLSRTVCAMRSTRPAPPAAFAALLKDFDLGRTANPTVTVRWRC